MPVKSRALAKNNSFIFTKELHDAYDSDLFTAKSLKLNHLKRETPVIIKSTSNSLYLM
jgi:hypothetical protein